MMNQARNVNWTCNAQVAQHLYGSPYEPAYLKHLDGRLQYMVDRNKTLVKEAAVIGMTSNTTSTEATHVLL